MSVKLADYLFARIRQLGVNSVFGVPGDYQLRLLDYVEPAGLHWVGNCNELNAAYAADGYARMNGLSAVVTTFGVGELSAINGIAGAYTEKAPVVHIVGTPTRTFQDTRTMTHHTMGDGDYGHFAAMASHVTAAQMSIKDLRQAPSQIDWVLRQALLHSRPVYLSIPDDMVGLMVDSSNLQLPIVLPTAPTAAHESAVLRRVVERMYAAQKPLILVDGEVRPMAIQDQVDALVRKTNWPTWTMGWGKGFVDEQLPNVYGVYQGPFSDATWKEYYDSADLIVSLGPHPSTTNTSIFAALPNPDVCITFSGDTVQIGNEKHRDISNSSFLTQLINALEDARIPKPTGPPKPAASTDALNPSDPITQKHFWRIANSLLREGDLVLGETGTASYGVRSFTLPSNTQLFGAVTWLSIGYMLPATFGAALAQRELRKGSPSRSILFIGDGSLQMTVQELSSIIRENLDVIVFVINNDGYTIERAIHGRKQPYNDVALWRHTQMLGFFGADEEHAKRNSFTARTWGELDAVLADEHIQRGKGVRVVEIFMEREDVEGALSYVLGQQIAKESNT